jgi:hypothetical protein
MKDKNETLPPSPEWIRDHLPEEMRQEFWAHFAKVCVIGEKTADLEEEMKRQTGRAVEIMPSLPPMRLELAKLVASLISQWHSL